LTGEGSIVFAKEVFNAALIIAQDTDVGNELDRMINVTRLNHTHIVLNSDLIEFIENTPDTVITMVGDRKMTVLETAEDVVERIRSWRRSLQSSKYPGGTMWNPPDKSDGY
jgi:flagellar protein FlbD